MEKIGPPSPPLPFFRKFQKLSFHGLGIDRSHRLGNLKKSIKAKLQPISEIYQVIEIKNTLYTRNKKVLKGEGISVTESLTSMRIKMLEKVRELHEFVNVWS